MRTLALLLLALAVFQSSPDLRAQSLVVDTSIAGYSIGRGTNAINSAGQVDSWAFDALAGDVVSISIDTPSGGLNPYVELRNSANGLLVADDDGGPGLDALIGAFAISSSGSYSIRVSGNSSTTGPYTVRLEIGRTVQLEADQNYGNDSIASANRITKTAVGVQSKATVAGTIMKTGPVGSADAGNVDEDIFSIGRLNAGNVVELSFRLPAGSTL